MALTKEEDLERVRLMWQYEKEKQLSGFKLIAGVDEAGRGPLAGPVYAAAVILPSDIYIEGINDSKKLSPKKREALFDIITRNAVSYYISSVNEKIIDEINILNATFLAMNDAIAHLTPSADFVLIDGNQARNIQVPYETIVKGDSKSISVAAASILAKVARDNYIIQQDKIHPGYGFAQHKGYGTKQHIDAIKALGPCDIHRQSFITKFV